MIPEIGLVAIDANVLDRMGRKQDAPVDRFLALVAAGVLKVMVPGGVRLEFEHPRTPSEVREAAMLGRVDLRRGLSAAQHISRIRVRAIMRGNARPEKHEADAAHLSDAAEAGCAYFITHDGRMLRKRGDLEASLPQPVQIVTLAEFLERLDSIDPDATLQGSGG